MNTILCLPLLLASAYGFAQPSFHHKRQLPPGGVLPDLNYFDTLTPSNDLNFVSCYDGAFQCARLNVPLDYEKPSGDKVQLAIVKRPAQVPVNDSSYTGTLYLSFGTGVSNTNAVLELGALFQGAPPAKYDVLGWDLRGIGQTTPKISAFPDEQSRVDYIAKAPPALDAPNGSIEATIDYLKTPADGFAARSKNLIPYYTTPNNARDMHTILQKSGRQKVDAFLGYSYGTVLGATYASLFPNDFGRMVLDGVVNAENHYSTTDNVYSAIRDAEKAFQVFFDTCSAGGPEQCPFWAATPGDVRKRFEKVEESLKKTPLPTQAGRPFDYSALHDVIFVALLSPRDAFGFLAGVLAEAESGQAGFLINNYVFPPPPPYENQGLQGPFEFTQAIQCTDALPFAVNDPKADFDPYLKRMLRISPSIGADVAQAKLACAPWDIPAAKQFNGDGAFDKRTPGPIVFVGNTADPITPLENAKSMSRKFRNSRVITVRAVGHTSTSYNSACKDAAIDAFFNRGELPARDLVCESDSTAFGQRLVA